MTGKDPVSPPALHSVDRPVAALWVPVGHALGLFKKTFFEVLGLESTKSPTCAHFAVECSRKSCCSTGIKQEKLRFLQLPGP